MKNASLKKNSTYRFSSSSHLLFKNEPVNLNETDLAKMRFHIQTGDYFAVLATIFGFVEDVTTEHERHGDAIKPLTSTQLKNLRKQLIYLQKNYRILPQETAKKVA